MFRRILFILVLLGLGFIVWRMINPTGANNALEDLKDLPGKIFSRDKNVVIEKQVDTGIKSDTVLEIDKLNTEDKNEEVTGDIKDTKATKDTEAPIAKENDLMEDALLDDEVVDDKTGQDALLDDEVIQDKTGQDAVVEINNEANNEANIDCRKAGEIALMNSDETKCCKKLNWIYYRGDNKLAGAICFNAEEGIPQCKNQGTSDEGRYYMDGTLLRKDLDCGDYFGTKYYKVDVTDDSASLKSILQNIFK